MKQMRNWPRYELAKKLRDDGLTYKKIGEQLGVSAGRASQMVGTQKSRMEYPVRELWHTGLYSEPRWALLGLGFNSKADCAYLCSDNLTIQGWHVILPNDERILISVVNEVREWLGVAKIGRRRIGPTDKDIEKAVKLLTRTGYKVEKISAEAEKPLPAQAIGQALEDANNFSCG